MKGDTLRLPDKNASLSTGGVSGKRTGEDGYVSTSYGPAGPLNTGYYSAPDYKGQTLSTSCPTTLVSNTTYNWCEWAVPLTIAGVTGVVIHGCIVHGKGSPHGELYTDVNLSNAKKVTFEYCEFRPPTGVHFQAHVPGGDLATSAFCLNIGTGSTVTVKHSECWGHSDGFVTSNAPGTLAMTYVWIHDWRDPAPNADHQDGTLDNCFSTTCTSMALNVSYSTISCSPCNTNAIGNQNGSQNGYSNQTFTHNYFAGFGYTVNLCGNGTGCGPGQNNVFTDNQFGDDNPAVYGNLYGAVYAHYLWRRNTWVNTLSSDNATNREAHNGMFVFPDGSLSTSDFKGT